MNIVYSSTTLLNVRPLTVVNGNACYEIEIRDKECPFKHAFVFTPQSTNFIAVKHADNIHIFNVKNDGDFSDEFKAYIDGITPSLRKFYGERTTAFGELYRISDEINNGNPYGFVIINPKKPPSDQVIVLDGAKSIVSELNAALQPTCPGFHLNIDYITSFSVGSTASLYSNVLLNAYVKPPLLLCLMHGDDCVSSITIKVHESEISIDSRTNDRYEGRKFNTLLRAVAIMISKSLSERTERLTSSAANIISAMLMIKRFNAVSEGGDISKDTPEIDKIINDYFEHRGGMESYVELNEANIANATRVFHETIQRMNCGPISGGLKRTKRNRKSNEQRKQRKQRKQRNQIKTRKTRKTRKIMKTRKPMKLIIIENDFLTQGAIRTRVCL
jgi:hypothetical protein